MPDGKRHLVYLASNAEGLELERYEIERQLARQGMYNIGFACRDDGSGYDWSLSRQQIETADLFILLVGESYGPMAPTGISFLHREFVHARTAGKPILSFIQHLPDRDLSPEQGRLKGFSQLVTQQGQYKRWHLRDELISHVRVSVAAMRKKLSGGWVKADGSIKTHVPSTKGAVVTPLRQSTPTASVDPVAARRRFEKTRQVVNLQIAAKVYEGGNLSTEELLLPVRLDQIHRALHAILSSSVSEDRLRFHLENVVSATVKKQLLKRCPRAHAVDDVRISKGQFRGILETLRDLGMVISTGEASRTYWTGTSAEVGASSV